MSLQHVKRALALFAATVIGIGTLIGLTASVAAAGTLTSADGFTTLTTIGTVTAHSPYSSGQQITVQVADNSTFDVANMEAAGYPSGADPIKFLECADPGGTSLPTLASECEPGTIHTISGAGTDGLGDMKTNYIVLALPDPNLKGNGTTC